MQTRLVRIVDDQLPAVVEPQPKAPRVSRNIDRFGILGSYTRPKWIGEAGSLIASTTSAMMDKIRDPAAVYLEDVPLSQAMLLRDEAGKPLVRGSVYARHPIAEDFFVSSERFHPYILNEQRSHIIRYFRSAVALKSLSIEIVSQKAGKFYVGGDWVDAAPKGKVTLQHEQRRWFSATYSDPKKEPVDPSEKLFWMTHFDEIVAATRDVAGGTIETSTSLDMSFGLSVEAAKVAKIDGNWLSRQRFVVKAEYA